MGKTKLVLINGNQFGYSAGHYYYCKYLKDQFDIQYICFDRNRKKLELENVKVHYVSFEGNKFIRIFRFLYQSFKICKQIKPDILFVVQFNLCPVLALFCKASIKVLDIRTGSLSTHSFKRNLDNFTIKLHTFFFRKKIILSESLRQKIKLRKKNLLVLPLGAEVFYSGSHEYSPFKLLYVGTILDRNIHQTIEGIGLFIQENPEFAQSVKYTIVGFGSDNDIFKLHEAIDKYKLHDQIFFEGLKNYDDLPIYFQNCNIGVAYIPITDFYNCQPATKIYEYALSGLYTIATNTDENKLAINIKNGVLCDDNAESFAKALKEVYNMRNSINETEIRNSLRNHQWDILVNNNLKPFLIN
jgi:hypothetical protein